MPKPSFRFCVPFNETLESEEGWHPGNERRTLFISSRFHFAAFRTLDEDPPTYFGESVDTIVLRKGVKIGTEIATKYTLQTTDTYKTIQNSLVENSMLQSLSSELAAQVGVPNVANSNTKLTAQLQTTLKNQFTKGFEISRTITTSAEVSYKQTFGFDAETEGREALICPTYRQIFFDLHLTHIDYLVVEYRKWPLSLRKKRKKHPALQTNRRPANLLKMNVPLVCLGAWLLNPSVAVKWKGERFKELEDPLEITAGPPKLFFTPIVEPPEKPSLYHLANTAFPTRWVKRKGPWTEEDLKQAELNESQNSAWWYEYGPGRQGDEDAA